MHMGGGLMPILHQIKFKTSNVDGCLRYQTVELRCVHEGHGSFITRTNTLTLDCGDDNRKHEYEVVYAFIALQGKDSKTFPIHVV